MIKMTSKNFTIKFVNNKWPNKGKLMILSSKNLSPWSL